MPFCSSGDKIQTPNMVPEVLHGLASIMLYSHHSLFLSYLCPLVLSEVPTWERTPYSTLDLLGFLCVCVIFHAGPSTLEFSYLTWTIRQTPMHPPRPNSSLTFSVKPSLAPPLIALNTCSLVPPLHQILTSDMEIIDCIVLLLSIYIYIFPISP